MGYAVRMASSDPVKAYAVYISAALVSLMSYGTFSKWEMRLLEPIW
jgi:hypothetical protein